MKKAAKKLLPPLNREQLKTLTGVVGGLPRLPTVSDACPTTCDGGTTICTNCLTCSV